MGWLANYWLFWYRWIIKDDLYSELDQLNKAYPSLGGETFLSYSGLRSFLGDPKVILWIENALEKKSHGWYLTASVSLPRTISSLPPDGGTTVPVPTLFACSPCSCSLHLFWGRLLLVSLSAATSPGSWMSAGLPDRALGFPEVCSYWKNTHDLHRVIVGQADPPTWHRLVVWSHRLTTSTPRAHGAGTRVLDPSWLQERVFCSIATPHRQK